MQRMRQKHEVQVLLADSVVQLRWHHRQACVACGTRRSQRCRRCNYCRSDTPLRELRVGDIGTRRPAVRHLGSNFLELAPGEPLDDSPLLNSPTQDVVLTERDK